MGGEISKKTIAILAVVVIMTTVIGTLSVLTWNSPINHVDKNPIKVITKSNLKDVATGNVKITVPASGNVNVMVTEPYY